MRYFLILIFVSLSSICFSQQGVKGKVIDANTSEALIAASVAINDWI